MADDCIECDKHCDKHMENTTKIMILEEKYEIMSKQTNTISALSTKVSLLLTIFSLIIAIVVGGAIYTFTGLSNFNVAYSEDKVKLFEKLSDTENKNKEMFHDSFTTLSYTLNNQINNLHVEINDRMNATDNKISTLENKVEDLKQENIKTHSKK